MEPKEIVDKSGDLTEEAIYNKLNLMAKSFKTGYLRAQHEYFFDIIHVPLFPSLSS